MQDRRTFFRGIALGAGAVHLAPFLRQLEAAEGAPARPMRVLFFVQGNGIYPGEVQPQGIAREREATRFVDRPLDGAKLAFSLEPLLPWLKRTTMIQGLSGRIARGSHNSGFAALGCWPMGKKAYGETIDAALARKLGGVHPHVGLGVDTDGDAALTYNITSAGKGRALPTLLDPAVAHRQYFAAGATGDARRDFDVDTATLDFLADDVRRMETVLSGTEKDKLARYLDAFEKMGARQSRLAGMADRIAKAAPQLEPARRANGPATGVFDRLAAQFDVAAGVLVAGLTNVVTVSAGAGPDKIGIGCTGEEVGKGSGQINAHAIGHGVSQAGLSAVECHALVRRKCLEQLARFLRTLESIPEGDGTMLDGTLVVYLSDSAEGHHPRCEEWPFVLIGDLGGRLRLGDRYLCYPGYGRPGHRTTANLYLSLLHAVGERRENFGIADSGLRDLDQSGPLAEILS